MVARLKAFEDAHARNKKLQAGLRALHAKHQADPVDLSDDGLIAQALREATKARTQALAPEGHNVWPAYMTRALPNPWSKDLPPW